MKNKKDKKPRKIKNYLSSLSKWAKENKKKLFCLFTLLALLLGVCYSNCRASKPIEASAYTLETDNTKVLVLPSMTSGFSLSSGTYYCFSTPILLEPTKTGVNLYVATSTNFNYTKRLTTKSQSDNNTYITNIPITYFAGFYHSSNTLTMRNLANTSGYSTYISIWLDYDLYGYDNPYDYFNNISINTILAESGAGYIAYYFKGSTGQQYAVVEVRNLNTVGTTEQYIGYPLYISFDYEGVYQDGYDTGYDTGYYEGYLSGLDSGTGFDENPLKPFANGIANLINRDIFGNFSLGDLIALAFGLILFGFAVKIFLGG